MENKVEANTQSEQQNEKRLKKNKDNLRELWDNMKCKNVHFVGIPEGEEREQGLRNLFEKIMTGHFPDLVREKVTQVQEA